MTATGIKAYSSTPASNSSAAPNGAPEGMAPSGVNDTMRQIMAEIRRWYEDPAWIDYGYTYSYVDAAAFKVSGIDVTANFVVGRRVRIVGSSTGTIYGTIATSAFSTDTNVTVTLDSGTVSNETLAVSIGAPTLGAPIPASAVSGITAPTDATVTFTDITTNNVTSTKHGYAPKSPADATKFLNGAATNAYAAVKDSDLAFTDVTTNNVTTSAHGFAPKAPNDATKFLDGTGAYSKPSAITIGTPNTTNSGTSVSYTGLPAGIKQIIMNLQGVTLNGVADVLFQIGDASGGLKTSGYLGTGTTGNTPANYTTGFGLRYGATTPTALSGSITFNLVDATNFIWVCTGTFESNSLNEYTSGQVTLAAALDRIAFTTVAGTATKTAGTINILYQ